MVVATVFTELQLHLFQTPLILYVEAMLGSFQFPRHKFFPEK